MDKKEKKEVNPSKILDEIIALTFTRHARLTEDEFLKEIQAPDGVDEAEWVRKSCFTLISAAMREILKANDKLNLINQTLCLSLDTDGKQTAKDRVQAELRELTEKTTKLVGFIGSEKFTALDGRMEELLMEQHEVMEKYADILTRRLLIWED